MVDVLGLSGGRGAWKVLGRCSEAPSSPISGMSCVDPMLIDRANALAEVGDFARAADLFRKASQQMPRADVLEPLAQCLLELDQPTAAAEAARAAVSKSPSWADAWLTLGRACLNAGQFAQASQALRQAVALELFDLDLDGGGRDPESHGGAIVRDAVNEPAVERLTLVVLMTRREGWASSAREV